MACKQLLPDLRQGGTKRWLAHWQTGFGHDLHQGGPRLVQLTSSFELSWLSNQHDAQNIYCFLPTMVLPISKLWPIIIEWTFECELFDKFELNTLNNENGTEWQLIFEQKNYTKITPPSFRRKHLLRCPRDQLQSVFQPLFPLSL